MREQTTPSRLTDEASCLAKKLPVSAEYFFFFLCGQRILGLMDLHRLGKWDGMGWDDLSGFCGMEMEMEMGDGRLEEGKVSV